MLKCLEADLKKYFLYVKKKNIKFDYESNTDGFSFTFYRNVVTLNVTNNVTLNTSIKLTTNDFKVLSLLKNNANQTREQLASQIGVDKRTVQRCLDKLAAANFIARIGSKKTGYWEVLK